MASFPFFAASVLSGGGDFWLFGSGLGRVGDGRSVGGGEVVDFQRLREEAGFGDEVRGFAACVPETNCKSRVAGVGCDLGLELELVLGIALLDAVVGFCTHKRLGGGAMGVHSIDVSLGRLKHG